MKERPILFNAPMVRALLDGTKTQTRRVVKPQPAPNHPHDGGTCWAYDLHENGLHVPVGSIGHLSVKEKTGLACPYGQPGDRLWVRETFGTKVRIIGGGAGEFTTYRATDPNAVYCKTAEGGAIPINWKPSIHMFRKDSRILLEITAVRVERLHDISEADALAEGVREINPYQGLSRAYARSYSVLWESINGPDSWSQNPWVWVIEFKRVQP